MKKKIFHSVFFMLGLVILITVFSVLLKPDKDVYNSVGVEKKIRDMNKEEPNSLDVVFLGDSESYSAFNPVQMYNENGYTSYVCGTSLQKLCDTYVLLQNVFERQSPKVVVLETNCLFRQGSPYGETDDKAMNAFSKAIPLMRYHDRWKALIPIEESAKSEDRNLKGFKYRPSVKPYTGGQWMNKTDSHEPINDCNMEYFNKITELANSRGAKIVLVSVPSPENWNYEKHNAVQALAEKSGIDFVDLNLACDKLGIDWNQDTKDQGNHLNYTGASKVSGYIGQYLSQKMRLPDHRKDENYRHWNDLDCKDLENEEEI